VAEVRGEFRQFGGLPAHAIEQDEPLAAKTLAGQRDKIREGRRHARISGRQKPLGTRVRRAVRIRDG
jgi:hypothetical protein